MSHIHNTLIGLCVTAVSLGAYAQNADEHKDHHPASTTSSAAAINKSPAKSVNVDKMASIDKQMKDMQTMHEKMTSAKALDERQALMAEHMTMMQEGMGMMKQMGGMGGMQAGKGMSGNMADRQKMMEKRMDMMESMMQMMIDSTPSAPTK